MTEDGDEGSESAVVEDGDEGIRIVMDSSLGCEGVETRVEDLQSELPSGFSARSGIMALVGGYETEIEWLVQEGPVTYVPGRVVAGLQLDFSASEDDSPTFVRALDCASGSTCAVSCLSQLQFSADVSVRSDDGVLDEVLRARIGTWKEGKAFARVPMELSAVEGTLDPTDFNVDVGWEVSEYQLELELNGSRASGRLQVFATDLSGSGVELGTLAVWPRL